MEWTPLKPTPKMTAIPAGNADAAWLLALVVYREQTELVLA